MKLLFHEYFSKLAEKMPEHPALCDEQGTLTYREADEMTNDLAASLKKAGL